MTRMRRLFLRARPDKMEINILRGTLVAIQKQAARQAGDPPRDDEPGTSQR
jgi:tRNA (cytidine32/uridine32-2'-O)-methyltransferase